MSETTNLKDFVLAIYDKLNANVLPVISGTKKPAFSWDEYYTERVTREILKQNWLPKFDSYGLICGKNNEFVCIDFDVLKEGEHKGKLHSKSRGLFDYLLEEYPTWAQKSGSGEGRHLIYKVDPLKPIPIQDIDEYPGVEIRGEKSYVIVAYSKHPSGNIYELVRDPLEDGVGTFPYDFFDGKINVGDTKHSKNKKIKSENKSDPNQKIKHPSRHKWLIKQAGYHCRNTPQWKEVIHSLNQTCCDPPLLDDELESVFNSGEKYSQDKNDEKKDKDGRDSQADRLIELVVEKIENGEIKLFHNELKETFARVKIKEHLETLSCKSKMFKFYLLGLYWKQHSKAVSPESLRTAIGSVEHLALFEGEEYKLYNRVARHNDAFWYDLTDKEHCAIKIASSGWGKIDNPPILFRRYSHQQPQAEPIKNGDIKLFLPFVNLIDVKNELLLLVYIVSCFIPGIPHPIINVYGVQGAAKSTLLRLIRKLVDPSSIGLMGLKRKEEQLQQILYHSWCVYIDNISRINDDISDVLCRAVTGDSSLKRELFTDDDDIIYNYQRCIGLNGINNIAGKTDLLERCISFELQRIPPNERKTEQEIFEEFEKIKSHILGGIFDAVVKAIQIKPTIILQELPRMADFAIWGCAIAEALGYSREEFLNAYNANMQNQNEEILSESLVAQTIISLMEYMTNWEGTASQLLKELEAEAKKLSIKENDKGFPKAANSLSREINRLKTDLESIGIKIWREKGNKRIIVIHKDEKNIVDTANTAGNDFTEQKKLNLKDDTDDDTQMEQKHKPSTENIENNEKLSNANDTDDKDDKNSISIVDDVDLLFEPLKKKEE